MDAKLPHLTPRLSLVASFVRHGTVIADIGTDHAYIPVWLVNSGICTGAVASDIKEGPLERARLTACEYDAQEKISFALADGLSGVSPSQADDIVIAGMGGELIANIISSCAWLKDPAKHLVLQPMTAQEELRKFLCENGFTIKREAVATEKGGSKLYLVMSVICTGERIDSDPVFLISGLLPKEGGLNEQLYIERKAQIFLKIAKGIRKSQSEDISKALQAEELAGKLLEICAHMR